MVTVTLQKAPLLALTAAGHAGAAPRGEDLVCAGISTLLCTLAAQLEQADGKCFVLLEPGFADLCAERTAQTEAAFSFAGTGLRLLASKYPQYLTVTER